MQLTTAQRRAILDDGYVKITGVVPRVMVDEARRQINHSLGERGIAPDELPVFRARSYCPEVQKHPAITALINRTPAWELIESLLGQGKVPTVTGGQIALRFPSLADPPKPARPHLDGMYSPNNGVPKGEIRNFTLLAAVLLSDQPEPNSGNFTVWPGTHRQHERYFQQRGPKALLDGMPEIDLPEPLPITGQAGDIVLAHYLLGHGISPNVSPNIRYACFFRVRHADHDGQMFETMTDAWLEWPGIREIMQ